MSVTESTTSNPGDWYQKKETDLQKIQREHLAKVAKNLGDGSDCMHNQCPQCHGTGVRSDGQACVHMISCPCPRCNVWM